VSRDSALFLDDIIDRVDRIQSILAEKQLPDFKSDDAIHESVLRHLTIIGEAAKQLPDTLRQQEPEIPWRKIARLRDLLVHVYFGIRDETIWKIVREDLSPLRKACLRLRASLTSEPD
jgi:uncharacterized protein with HEPN domain